MASSTKNLFRATRPKSRPHPAQAIMGGLPEAAAPAVEDTRDPLDYDPTPGDATRAFLAVEGNRMREIGGPVWEPAVGGGHMAREIERAGFDVIGSDIVDRGWPGTEVRSFYQYTSAWPIQMIVTNPPYGELSAGGGHGRWLRHIEDLGIRYAAMLISWEWPAGRINGLDELHERFPMSRVYLCCWKIDFRGQGRPAQRNAWVVWDRDWQGETVLRRLPREAGDAIGQGSLL
jgi:hypothetical protein